MCSMWALPTFVLGIWLLVLGWSAFATSGWLWLKIAGVVALVGYHHYCGRLIRDFAAEANRHSQKFYRMFNEVPTLLLIAIVLGIAWFTGWRKKARLKSKYGPNYLS